MKLAGFVPVLGDVFDAAGKSNLRNVALLERFLERPVATRAASRFLVGVVITSLALLAAGGIALAIVLVRVLFGG